MPVPAIPPPSPAAAVAAGALLGPAAGRGKDARELALGATPFEAGGWCLQLLWGTGDHRSAGCTDRNARKLGHHRLAGQPAPAEQQANCALPTPRPACQQLERGCGIVAVSQPPHSHVSGSLALPSDSSAACQPCTLPELRPWASSTSPRPRRPRRAAAPPLPRRRRRPRSGRRGTRPRARGGAAPKRMYTTLTTETTWRASWRRWACASNRSRCGGRGRGSQVQPGPRSRGQHHATRSLAFPCCPAPQADGNCFFRSVVDQLEVRGMCSRGRGAAACWARPPAAAAAPLLPPSLPAP